MIQIKNNGIKKNTSVNHLSKSKPVSLINVHSSSVGASFRGTIPIFKATGSAVANPINQITKVTLIARGRLDKLHLMDKKGWQIAMYFSMLNMLIVKAITANRQFMERFLKIINL